MLRRVEAADTTWSLEQVRHFYYGAATKAEYNPYFSLLHELNEALGKGDLQKADSIIDRQLAVDPANLQFYEHKMMLKIKQFGRDSKESDNAFFQVFMLSSAILSSATKRNFITLLSDSFPSLSSTLCLRLWPIAIKIEVFPKSAENKAYVDLSSIKFPLTIRTRRNGDIIQPFGMQGKMKLKKYFINKNIPEHDRDKLLVGAR